MINVVTIEANVREILAHDCDVDHVSVKNLVLGVLEEIETPADVALSIIITTNLTAEWIRSMMEMRVGNHVTFAAVTLAPEIESDNEPDVVAARLVACMLNRDLATVQAIAQAETLEIEHAQETLVSLLMMAHDL